MDPKTAEIVETAEGQIVRLPEEFRFQTNVVSIRRAGNAVILEPLKPVEWPEGFFESIYIDDPAFVRPDQGPMPPAPVIE
ncbi:MAG: AbrB/MazE/SpoVT family DNA-binding domain-containing protein [Planctomycetes bacterium]|nr:AbrB/MazE/SpoVT family DNA-binding domain-containing protein [Planctomycetota bacterium]